jgi:ferrous iron transport protein B
LAIDHQVFLQVPSLAAIWRESEVTLCHFLKKAMRIFLVIAVLASLLDWAGVISLAGAWLRPMMVIFDLPADAVLPVVLASIRKDEILLLVEPTTPATLTEAQVLTATYLAGVLLPCLVTAITIATEKLLGFALRLVARQMAAAIFYSLILAWTAEVALRPW